MIIKTNVTLNNKKKVVSKPEVKPTPVVEEVAPVIKKERKVRKILPKEEELINLE